MPDELEVKRRMTMFNLTARQIHLSHTDINGNPENQLVPPPPIMRDLHPSCVPAFQSVRASLCGDEISTAAKVAHPALRVERPKLTPANPTNGPTHQPVPFFAFRSQAKVESPAQPAVHPRSDRPKLCAAVPTKATEAAIGETKRSERAMTGPQSKPFKLTPTDLTCPLVNHSVPFVPPAKVESQAQAAVHFRSDRLQSSAVLTEAEPVVTGIKRKRLGMGRGGAEYTNKKFKVPASS